jgi:hypothetical protein
VKGRKERVIAKGFAFRKDAELALAAHLKINHPDAYLALFTGRGELED